ncbi:MAG: biotin/lipoyl-binding protein [Burkholderiaceae bacterium]
MNLLHEQWHRVRGLAPRWRPGTRMDRQPVRGECWYLLSDESGGTTVRLNARAYTIVGRCDGRRTLDQIWQTLLAQDARRVRDARRAGDAWEADDARLAGADRRDRRTDAHGRDDAWDAGGTTTQGDVLALVARLVGDGLLDCDGAVDVPALGDQAREQGRRQRRARLMPWAMRFALCDPSRALERGRPLARALFGPAGAAAWLALVLWAGWFALDHSATLAREIALATASPSAWLLAWLVFIPVKAVHEAAHALAIERFGGTVREAGIGLLLGMPAPYVDASHAHRFGSAGQRALVSAAGILAELALAAIGVLAWANSDPDSLVHRLALIVALTGTVSTLWFNANPLARMDGYYLLTDLLRLPNLAERSGAFWHERALRMLLGIRVSGPLAPAARETPWLWLYAPAAWTYRAALCAWVTLWLGGIYAPLGIATALAAIFGLLVKPIAGWLRAASAHANDRRQDWRARLRLAAAVAVAALIALGVPLPDRVVATGIVWVPEPAQLRAGDDGFVVRVAAVDGQPVRAGQPIVELDDPQWQAESRRLDAERERLAVARGATLFSDPAQGGVWTESLRQLDEQRARLAERIASLRAEAPSAGRLALPFADDLPGRFFRRGDRLGDVLDDSRPPIVRLVLAEHELTRIPAHGAAVRLGFAHLPWPTVDADWLRDTPAPLERLPGAALATTAGGPIEIDPADKDRLEPLRPVYAIDVQARQALPAYPGERVDVRIDCGWLPLAAMAARALRHTFRAGFSAQAI